MGRCKQGGGSGWTGSSRSVSPLELMVAGCSWIWGSAAAGVIRVTEPGSPNYFYQKQWREMSQLRAAEHLFTDNKTEFRILDMRNNTRFFCWADRTNPRARKRSHFLDISFDWCVCLISITCFSLLTCQKHACFCLHRISFLLPETGILTAAQSVKALFSVPAWSRFIHCSCSGNSGNSYSVIFSHSNQLFSPTCSSQTEEPAMFPQVVGRIEQITDYKLVETKKS